MKLIESINDSSGDIKSAIKTIVDELFDKELEDKELDTVADSLKLSDILALDNAYTNNDRDQVAEILGQDLVEYSMGGASASSTANNRPTPQRRTQTSSNKSNSDSGTSTQVNRNYSGTQPKNTTNITNVDDDSVQIMQDPEAIEESDNNQQKKYYAAVAKQLGVLMSGKGRLTQFQTARYSRIINIDIRGNDIEIFQSWAKDGSPKKPWTELKINYEGDYTILDLGRFSIWSGDPKFYAEDIFEVISNYLNDENDDIDESLNELRKRAGIK